MISQDIIIERTAGLFEKYGIKVQTMDDVAYTCGISKKTLYTHFANKHELVDAVISSRLEQIEHYYERNQASARDAISETMGLLRYFEEICRKMNARMLEELQRYYHEVWLKTEVFKNELMKQFIRNNVLRGRYEELYHDAFDIAIIAKMRLWQMTIIYEHALQEDRLHEIIYQTTLHYLTGIATLQGLQLIKEIQERTNTI